MNKITDPPERDRWARLRFSVIGPLMAAPPATRQVDLVDGRTGVVLCPIKPLDKAANANGQRRRLDPVGQDLSALPPTGMAPLLRELLAEYAATGMPPAYLPVAEPTPAITPAIAPINPDINPPEADPA